MNKEKDKVEENLNEKTIIDYNGKIYHTMRELCMDYKIQQQIVSSRVRGGWSLEKALTTPVKEVKTSKRSYKYKGKVYTTKRRLTESEGFDTSYIETIQKRTGLELVESLEVASRFIGKYKGNRPELIGKMPFIIYDEEWFNTLKSFCEKIGTTSRQLKDYMMFNKSKSHYEALKEMKEKEQSFPDITFDPDKYFATPDLDFEHFLKERYL